MFIALDLALDVELWRVPLTVETTKNGVKYSYACLLLAGYFEGSELLQTALLGRSTAPALSYIPLAPRRLSVVLEHVKMALAKNEHELQTIWLGAPVGTENYPG